MSEKRRNVLVVGGAGYVGAVLVPKLLKAGHKVTVLDLYIFGDDVLASCKDDPNLTEIKGDMREEKTVVGALKGCNTVIHLACISNDPSFELDPELGKSINFDSFRPLVQASKEAGVNRFIYASSSSVYGIKEGVEVTEELSLEPLTDYSKFKVMCEEVLAEERQPGFVTLVIRPATVCGYSPRQRLDVIVNILTNHAVNNGKIKVFGGNQLRPNLHIEDMTDLYLQCLELPDQKIDGKTFNAGYENHTVSKLAAIVREGAGGEDIEVEVVPTNDERSYHVCSDKIANELGFVPKHTVREAVDDLVRAFKEDRLPESMTASRYFNIKVFQEIALK